MNNEELVAKFNEKFPVGAKVFWRSVGKEGVPYKVYTVYEKAHVHNEQAVCGLFERVGVVPIDELFVDYSRVPGQKRRLGRFEISNELLQRSPEHLRNLLDSMIIIESAQGQTSGGLYLPHQSYLAESEHFDEVTEGDFIPKYKFFFERSPDGAVTLLPVSKVETLVPAEYVEMLENCVSCVKNLFGYREDDPMDFCTFIPADFNNIKNRIERLKIALADAIRSPMGIVPHSAEGLLSQEEIEAAEARRSDGSVRRAKRSKRGL